MDYFPSLFLHNNIFFNDSNIECYLKIIWLFYLPLCYNDSKLKEGRDKCVQEKMSLAQKVNVLRASVMGANDGIISIAGIVIGVAAATSNARSILIAGLSGTLAGMISMCMGSTFQFRPKKDSKKMALISEKQRLQNQYEHEFDYVQKEI